MITKDTSTNLLGIILICSSVVLSFAWYLVSTVSAMISRDTLIFLCMTALATAMFALKR